MLLMYSDAWGIGAFVFIVLCVVMWIDTHYDSKTWGKDKNEPPDSE